MIKQLLVKWLLNWARTPRGRQISYKAYYLSAYHQWCEENTSPNQFKLRDELRQHLLDNNDLKGPIDYLEFGVAKGKSIFWWVDNNKDPGSTFTGFDSFEGLPEQWKDYLPVGALTQHGKVPQTEDPRCKFEVGLIQYTLPPFITRHEFKNKKVIHLDADLYSSTIFALMHLSNYLKEGDIIIFDEFKDLKHEFKAFLDFKDARNFKFKLLGMSGHGPYNYKRVAMEIVGMPDY